MTVSEDVMLPAFPGGYDCRYSFTVWCSDVVVMDVVLGHPTTLVDGHPSDCRLVHLAQCTACGSLLCNSLLRMLEASTACQTA
jgi:hypothetical protein